MEGAIKILPGEFLLDSQASGQRQLLPANTLLFRRFSAIFPSLSPWLLPQKKPTRAFSLDRAVWPYSFSPARRVPGDNLTFPVLAGEGGILEL